MDVLDSLHPPERFPLNFSVAATFRHWLSMGRKDLLNDFTASLMPLLKPFFSIYLFLPPSFPPFFRASLRMLLPVVATGFSRLGKRSTPTGLVLLAPLEWFLEGLVCMHF